MFGGIAVSLYQAVQELAIVIFGMRVRAGGKTGHLPTRCLGFPEHGAHVRATISLRVRVRVQARGLMRATGLRGLMRANTARAFLGTLATLA